MMKKTQKQFLEDPKLRPEVENNLLECPTHCKDATLEVSEFVIVNHFLIQDCPNCLYKPLVAT